MEKSSKRGKIPQSDWPLIMTRYEAGETLASIARTYDCSPPAISYVVSRSRARHAAHEVPVSAPLASEPQLIKAAPEEVAAAPFAPPPSAAAAPAQASANPRPDDLRRPESAISIAVARRDEPPPRETNGAARNGFAGLPASAPLPPAAAPHAAASRLAAAPLQRPPMAAAQPTADQRRTLHLPLGGTPHGNGGPPPAEPQPPERPPAMSRGQMAEPYQPYPPQRDREVIDPTGFLETRQPAYAPPPRGDGNGAHRKDVGTFIDQELRARVEGDITVFLRAFDDALAQDTQESRAALREATDRLLRAGARTRIELERLEARLPLPARDGGGRGDIAWRHR